MKQFLAACSLAFSPILAAQNDTIVVLDFACDTTVTQSISTDVNSVTIRFIPEWIGSTARIIYFFVNDQFHHSWGTSVSGDTVQRKLGSIDNVPALAKIGFKMYEFGTGIPTADTSDLPTIYAPVWRDGVDTLHMEIVDTLSNDTMFTVVSNVNEYAEPGLYGCSNYHLVIEHFVIDTVITRIDTVDVTAGESLIAHHEYSGPQTEVCMYQRLMLLDIGTAGALDFVPGTIGVPVWTHSLCHEMGIPTGLPDTETAAMWKVFPNPSCGEVSVEGLLPNEKFSVSGVDSKIIFASKAEGGITRINTESWEPGMYFIRTATSSTNIVRE